MNEIPLDHAAYHEAGHAVAAYLFRQPIMWVSILPAGSSAGRTCSKRRRSVSVDEQAVCSLAGLVAQVIYIDKAEGIGEQIPDSILGAIGDLRHICRLIGGTIGHWSDRAHRLYQETIDVIDQHWPAVEAVARALLRRGKLSGRSVRRIVRTAMLPAA